METYRWGQARVIGTSRTMVKGPQKVLFPVLQVNGSSVSGLPHTEDSSSQWSVSENDILRQVIYIEYIHGYSATRYTYRTCIVCSS